MAGLLLGDVVAWLFQQAAGMLTGLAGLLTAALLTTPDVTGLPQTTHLARISAGIVSAGYVVAILAAAATGMSHGALQARYELKDLLPRLVVGYVASHFGVEFCRIAIGLANALVTAFADRPAPGPRIIAYVSARLASAMGDPAAALLAVVIALIIVALSYLLLIGWFTRVALLVVLAGIAPLALACYALPYTQPMAGLWWRSVGGCLAVPAAQALLLTVGVDLLTDPDVNVAVLLGVATPGTDVFNLALAAALLALAVRVPKLIGRFVSQPPPSTAGLVLRAVLLQTVTRNMPLRFPR